MTKPQKLRHVQLVGQKLRQLRKERRLTQTEVSTRIGIQQSDLSRMEKGEYRVSLDTLFRILAEFNMSVSEFFDEVARDSLTPRDVHLVHEFNSLAAEDQQEVQNFIAFKRTQHASGNGSKQHDPLSRDLIRHAVHSTAIAQEGSHA